MKKFYQLLFGFFFSLILTPGLQAQKSCSFIIHVDGGAGKDTITSGAENVPCASINYGIDRAIALGYKNVRIKTGNYTEIIKLVDGISLWGGFDVQWTQTGVTTITGGLATSGEFYTVIADSINSSTVISDFDILAPNANIAGKSSYGVHISNSTGLKFQRVIIQGGNGANGAGGTNGTNATVSALAGSSGTNAVQMSVACDATGRGIGGNGAVTPGFTATGGGRGGDGGTMDTYCIFPSLNYSATPGNNGQSANTFLTNSYGYRGLGSATCAAGGNGSNGLTFHGTGGAGAASSASLTGKFWTYTKGDSGTLGVNGTGGGGGGGSGGCDNGTDSYGAGGGGGGSGGIAATITGKGGMSGGNSVAVFMISSTCSFVDCQIILGIGGNGGTGGIAGNGTAGGNGGNGGLAANVGSSQAGGKGGNGGAGGNSGGGGGGAGGSAYAVYGTNSIINRATTTISGGTAGIFGNGGSGTPATVAGTNGAAGSVTNFGGTATDNPNNISPVPDPCMEIITADPALITYCAGTPATINYNAVGKFLAGNNFKAELSDALGSFASPVNIGSVASLISGSIPVVFPLNTVGGTAYRIRVVSSTPSLIGAKNPTNISIFPLPDTTITKTGNMLSSNLSGATYQWVDCNNNYAVIPGKTAISFTPLNSGSYAVIVSKNNCTDTSSCYPLTIVGLKETSIDPRLNIYPNPSYDGKFEISSSSAGNIQLEVLDIAGKLLLSKTLTAKGNTTINLPYKGIYFIHATFADGLVMVQKVLVF